MQELLSIRLEEHSGHSIPGSIFPIFFKRILMLTLHELRLEIHQLFSVSWHLDLVDDIKHDSS
jgi:hypothetical protein